MKLLYFSWIRERVGTGEEEIDLPEGIDTVADLMTWQKGRDEAFEAVFLHEKVIRVALDQVHAEERSARLEGVREIAFFPPMTGG